MDLAQPETEVADVRPEMEVEESADFEPESEVDPVVVKPAVKEGKKAPQRGKALRKSHYSQNVKLVLVFSRIFCGGSCRGVQGG